MKKIVFVLLGFLLFSFKDTYSPEIGKYIAFLNTKHESANDYILDLWDKYDIVILCERAHPENTQYQLILDIIKNKRFINNVGNVFTEVGVVSMQEKVNDFIHRKYVNDSLLNNGALDIHRNIAPGDRPVWMMYNFFNLITEMNKINSKLSESSKINLFVSDVPFQDGWQNISTAEARRIWERENMKNRDRDSTMAENIINKLNSLNSKNKKRTKCLVILNNRHAFKNNYVGNYNYKVNNAAKIIFDRFPNQTANVYINWFAERPSNKTGNEEIDSLYAPVQNGKWDAAFNVLSIKSLGFDFKDSPFGKDNFDYIPFRNDFTYQDMFTGFVYYLPFEEHLCIYGIPGIVNTDFKKEYYRRCKLLYSKIDTMAIKNDLEYLNSKDIQKYPWTETATRTVNKWIK
jgi:hypothetical protein